MHCKFISGAHDCGDAGLSIAAKRDIPDISTRQFPGRTHPAAAWRSPKRGYDKIGGIMLEWWGSYIEQDGVVVGLPSAWIGLLRACGN